MRLILLFALLMMTSTTHSQPSGRNLFTPANPSQTRNLPIRPEQVGTERIAYVTLNHDALALAGASRHIGRVINDPGVVLNLFDDTVYTAVNTSIEPRSLKRNGYIWYGNIPGVAFSSVVMVVSDEGTVDIRVLLPGKSYYIDSAGNGVYRVSEIDTYEQRGGEDYRLFIPEVEKAPLQPRSEPACIDPPNTPCLIDVMVVYTSQAAAFLGGEVNMQLAIENTVALTNLTYINSSIHFRIRLVHTEQVTFNENPAYNIEVLQNPSDGVIDHIHLLRDQYRADLVALIPGTSATERRYCGIANLPTVINEANLPDESGFSVTEALCISDITFPHELGHNMGKAHDRANAFAAVHPYAYGYQDRATPKGADWGDFVTVMAYSTGGECPPVYQPGVCPAIAWWSNPNMTINGKPLGTSDENNALSLNQTARLISQYRISTDNVQPTPTPTSQPIPTERLLNGGFEIDVDGDRTPDGWSGMRVLKCNKPDKPPAAYGGTCAVRLKEARKVQQKLSEVGGLAQGDVLTLMFYAKGKGRAELIVRYVDPSIPKQTLTVTFDSLDYAPFSGNLTLQGLIQKAKVRLIGEGLADKLSLTVQSAAR